MQNQIAICKNQVNFKNVDSVSRHLDIYCLFCGDGELPPHLVGFQKVKEEYDLMNGHAENLTIRLYDSRESLKNGNCLGEKVYSD